LLAANGLGGNPRAFFVARTMREQYIKGMTEKAPHRNPAMTELRLAPQVEIVTVKMPQSFVAAIDDLAARQFRSRSDIIRQGLLKELEANGLVPLAAA
jgi:TRAP-type uncharacterized transport system substrate-binding protein